MLDGTGQRLRGRMAGHADLAECQGLVPPWLPMERRVREALPAIWTRLLGQPGFNADVIEDVTRAPGQRLVALGMSVALDDAWQRRLRDDPPAFVAAELYTALLDGRYAPPPDKMLGVLNGRGDVSFLVLHYHQHLNDLADADTLELLAVAMALFRNAHAGYRLRELYQEGLGPEGEYLVSMGFRARTQRAGAEQPQLYGLTREEAMRLLPGTPVRDAFQFTPPLLGFGGAERRLLRLAVNDLTDEQIGDELGISAHTVKKLWRDAHARALESMPQLFSGVAGSPGDGTRGPEKRRNLLQYLRQHPEELRPFTP